jgi:hypothetical protein
MSFSAGGIEIQLAMEMSQFMADLQSAKGVAANSMAEIARSTGSATSAIDQMSESAKANIKAMIGIADANNSASYAGKAMVENLKQQIATFGMSKDQIDVYKASLYGVEEEYVALKARLDQMRQAQAAFTEEMNSSGVAIKAAGKSAEEAGGLTAGMTREFIVLGHEAMMGNFSRIPGSIVVLGERMGGLHTVAEAVLTPLGMSLTAIAAAVATVSYEMVKGAEEQKAMNDALLLTGSYAGVTSDGMMAMAHAITMMGGTIGTAKEAILALTESGKFAAAEIQRIGEAATLMHAATGAAVKDTVAQFEELAKSPAAASAKLNDQYHYLTAAVYEQILALEKQGDKVDAAKLAEDQYAAAIKQRADEIHSNLGNIASWWQDIKKATSDAVDAVESWGKKATAATEVARLMAQVAQDEKTLAGAIPGGVAADNITAKLAKEKQDLAVAQRTLNDEQLRAVDIGIQQQTQAAAIHAASILEEQDAKGKKDSALQLALARNAENEALVRAADLLNGTHSAYVTDEAIQARRIATIREYTRASDDASKSTLEGVLKGYQLEEEASVKHYEQLAKLAEVYHKAGIIDSASYEAAQRQALDAEYAAQLASYDKQIKALQDYHAKSNKEREDVQNKIRAAYAERDKLVQDHADKTALLDAQNYAAEQENLNALIAGIDKASATEMTRLQKLIDEQKLHNAEIGKTKDQIELAKKAFEDQATDEMQRQADAIDVMLAKNQALVDYGDILDVLDPKIVAIYDAELSRLRQAIELRRQYSAALDQGAVLQADADAARKAQEIWKSTATTIDHDLENAILDGGNAYKKLFKDMEREAEKVVLHIPIEFISSGLSTFLTGIAPTQSTLLSAFGTASNGANVYSGMNGLASLLGIGQEEAGLSLMGGVSTLSSGATAFSDAAFTASQAAGTAASTGFMAGLQSAVAAVPGWGWALAGAALLGSNLIGGGETRSGGGYNIQGGKAIYAGGPSGGELDPGNVHAAIENAYSGLTGLLKALGSDAVIQQFTAGLESSTEGRGGTFAGGVIDGHVFGQRDQEKVYNQSLTPQQAEQQLAANLQQAVVQALQAAADIPKSIKDELAGVDAKSLTDQAAAALVSSITQEVAGVNQLRDALNVLPAQFANLKNLSFDAADSLIKVAGGVQNLQSEIGYFSQNFYSDGERAAAAADDVKKQLAALGYTGITTDAQFRAIVEGLNLTTDAGQKAEDTLLKLAPEFKQVADAAQQAAKEQADAQAKAFADAQTAQAQLNQQWQGKIDQARSDLQNAYDTQSKGIEDTIKSLQDFSASILSFRDSLLTSNLSTLSPADQYAQARQAFDKDYSLSLSGDQNAMGRLQSDAQLFLEQSRSYNASTAQYAADFNLVQQALSNSAMAAQTQVQIQQNQLAVLQQQLAGLVTVNSSVLTVQDAIQNLASTLAQARAAGAQVSPYGAGVGVTPGGQTITYDQWIAQHPGIPAGPDAQAYFASMYGQMPAALSGMSDANMAPSTYQGWLSQHPGIPDGADAQTYYNTLYGAPNGSHAGGLERVPFNGYRAILHENERVQTASQVRAADLASQKMVGLLEQLVIEARADKTQRAAIAARDAKQSDKVVSGLSSMRRTAARASAK